MGLASTQTLACKHTGMWPACCSTGGGFCGQPSKNVYVLCPNAAHPTGISGLLLWRWLDFYAGFITGGWSACKSRAEGYHCVCNSSAKSYSLSQTCRSAAKVSRVQYHPLQLTCALTAQPISTPPETFATVHQQQHSLTLQSHKLPALLFQLSLESTQCGCRSISCSGGPLLQLLPA